MDKVGLCPEKNELWKVLAFQSSFFEFLLSIVLQELPDFTNRLFQYFNTRQINHAEMIRLMPVKSTSLNDQDLLVTKQIKSKFLIIHNIEFLRINLREHIKCSLRFYCADSRNIRQSLVHIHAARKYVHPEQYNHLHSGVRQELSVQWTVPER